MVGTTEGSFTSAFVRQMLLRIALALGAMALSYGGSVLGELVDSAWGPFVGGLLGLAIGIACVVLVLRRPARSET